MSTGTGNDNRGASRPRHEGGNGRHVATHPPPLLSEETCNSYKGKGQVSCLFLFGHLTGETPYAVLAHIQSVSLLSLRASVPVGT